jgi:hypothetical protein
MLLPGGKSRLVTARNALLMSGHSLVGQGMALGQVVGRIFKMGKGHLQGMGWKALNFCCHW